MTFDLTNHYLNSWSLRCILQPELFFQKEKSNYIAHQRLLITLKIQTSHHAIRSLHYLFCACITDPLLPPLPRTLKAPAKGAALVLPIFSIPRSLHREAFSDHFWMSALFPALAYLIHWFIRDLPSFIVLSEFLFLISQVNHWVSMMSNLKSKPLPVILVKY